VWDAARNYTRPYDQTGRFSTLRRAAETCSYRYSIATELKTRDCSASAPVA
jgi:hypothetical protein